MTQVEGTVQGQQTLQVGVRQHIRVEWSRAAPAGAAPAGADQGKESGG
jgi:hypothetical protein